MQEKTVKINITTIQEILENMSKNGISPTDYIWKELHQMYGRELSNMFGYAQTAQQPLVYLGLGHTAGSQFIIDFAISDLALAARNAYNWHGQNTSQWLYAGAIVYDKEDKSFSAHH